MKFNRTEIDKERECAVISSMNVAIIIVRELPCLSDGIVLFMVHIPTFFIFFFHLVCFGVGGACQHAAALRSSTRQLDTWREDMFWRGSPCRLDSIFAYTWQKIILHVAAC